MSPQYQYHDKYSSSQDALDVSALPNQKYHIILAKNTKERYDKKNSFVLVFMYFLKPEEYPKDFFYHRTASETYRTYLEGC